MLARIWVDRKSGSRVVSLAWGAQGRGSLSGAQLLAPLLHLTPGDLGDGSHVEGRVDMTKLDPPELGEPLLGI